MTLQLNTVSANQKLSRKHHAPLKDYLNNCDSFLG